MDTTWAEPPSVSWPQLPNGAPRRVTLPGSDLLVPTVLSHSSSTEYSWDGASFDGGSSGEEHVEERVEVTFELAGTAEYAACAPLVLSDGNSVTEEPQWSTPPQQLQVEEDTKMDDDLRRLSSSLAPGDSKMAYTEGKTPRTFHQLLLEIAAEHQRSLVKIQQETEERLRPSRNQELETQPLSTSTSHFPVSNATWGEKASNRQFRGMSIKNCGEGKRCSPFDINSEPSDGPSPSVTITEHLMQRLASLLRFGTAYKEVRKSLRNVRNAVFSTAGFDVLSTVMILANSVLFGVAANESVIASMQGDHPDDFSSRIEWLTTAFSVWFSLEVCLRLYWSGFKGYFFGEQCTWNWFDFLVVGADVTQTAVEHVSERGSSALDNLTVMRMLRILRITRAVRVLRVIRFCRELRMMVFSVLRSGPALLWSLLLFGIFIYIFAVYFVQVVAYHVYSTKADESLDSDHAVLQEMFGDLLRAEYTLYQAATGGVSWGEVSRVLLRIDILHAFVFCFFTFFTTFALLNIITGIFVESSINSAKSSQEEVAQDQMDASRQLCDEMKRFFESADIDSSGSITLAEFETYLDRREVKAYLNALGIEIDKAKGLFQLLDTDGSGEITVDEFTFGCMRLKGNAKSIDLATLMNHTRRINEQMHRFYSWTEEQFKALHEFQITVETSLACLRGDELPTDVRTWKDMDDESTAF